MSESLPPSLPPNAELMRALRRLVRGLSALFWGLPIALLVCVQNQNSDLLRTLKVFPPVLAMGLVYYALREMSFFHKTERPWRDSMELTKLFALVNLGLSPFVFLWGRLPNEPFFAQAVGLLALSSVFFLSALNRSLERLSAMLPDETLREETRMFSSLNLWLMVAVLLLALAYQIILQIANNPDSASPKWFVILFNVMDEARSFLLLFLVLLPLSITMTMIWKIKEAVLGGVFGNPR